jgi:hypothetical protein
MDQLFKSNLIFCVVCVFTLQLTSSPFTIDSTTSTLRTNLKQHPIFSKRKHLFYPHPHPQKYIVQISCSDKIFLEVFYNSSVLNFNHLQKKSNFIEKSIAQKFSTFVYLTFQLQRRYSDESLNMKLTISTQ